MNSQIFLVCQLLVVAAASAINGTTRSNGSTNLVSLGTVDGKSFFFDSASGLTWQQAQAYCKGLGMRLAEITTDTQVDFLASKFGFPGFTEWYWIGGRDAKLPRALSWDSTGTELGLGLTELPWLHVPTSPQLCALFGSYEVPRWEINLCSSMYSNVKTLCETTN